jgi:hypothetical protein
MFCGSVTLDSVRLAIFEGGGFYFPSLLPIKISRGPFVDHHPHVPEVRVPTQ